MKSTTLKADQSIAILDGSNSGVEPIFNSKYFRTLTLNPETKIQFLDNSGFCFPLVVPIEDAKRLANLDLECPYCAESKSLEK